MQTPSVEEINSELKNIFASKYFRYSGILQKFLRFVVDKTLDGNRDEIKEYTVGVEMLERPLGFNPQQDASVRIHAVRLRKVLNAWYEDGGRKSSVRILIEKALTRQYFCTQGPCRCRHFAGYF